MFWKENISFKNLSVPRFMSAPIDGYLDSPMRQLIRLFSPKELVFGQMRHVASIANCKILLDEFNIQKIEHPICFQISANSTDFIEDALDKILEQKSEKHTSVGTFNAFEMINLNVGCPAKKTVGSGTGSVLMSKPKLLEKMIKLIIKKINNQVPFTIKIRSGYAKVNALEISQMAENLGVDGIIIHPRLKPQGFTGDLNFELVKKIKSNVKIPVIFSGNIVDAESTKRTYELTGVDGFMIGRALYGAPWKMKEIKASLLGENFVINEKEKIDLAIKHLDLNMAYYKKNGFNILKKHLGFYIKGMPKASKIRQSLILAQNELDMKTTLTNLKESF